LEKNKTTSVKIPYVQNPQGGLIDEVAL